MTAHTISILGLLVMSITLYRIVGSAQRAQGPSMSKRAMKRLVIAGYALAGAFFVSTIAAVSWLDGLIGFCTLCAALYQLYQVARTCPGCGARRSLVEATLLPPTRHCPGVGIVLDACHRCGRDTLDSHTLPSLAETAAEAGPWHPADTVFESAFGGRSTAGSGGGASWQPNRKG